MKLLKILLLSAMLTLPTIQSCQKEEFYTSAEQKGLEIKKIVAEKNIKNASAYKYDSVNASWDFEVSGSFTIEGSFVNFQTYSYSLDCLFKYSCLSTENGWIILFYFQ